MLRPPPQLTVSEWAERHRMLGSRASAEPGPWRTSRTPYLKDVMDALSAVHPARRVVLMKGAQVGATESGNNWLGYIMHHAPAPTLAVQPTVDLAKRFSRQRIDPLLEETPALRERVAPARARDSGNTLLSKEFPGGILVLTGANSAVGLRSMTARFLFLDEVDAYPGDVAGEGDPIALAEARARTFGWRRKAFLVSTPTIAGRSRTGPNGTSARALTTAAAARPSIATAALHAPTPRTPPPASRATPAGPPAEPAPNSRWPA